VDEDLRTIGETLHMITSSMNPAGKGAAAYPDLGERLEAIDVEKYPVGILRPVYAMFTNDDERLQRYLAEARGGRDEWLAAASWLMEAGAAENDGNIGETAVAAAATALDRFRALGERWGLSTALRAVGNLRVIDGDLDGAVAAFTEAGRLLAELGHDEDMSQVQLRLAEIAARQGDVAKARELSVSARRAAEADGSAISRGIIEAWWAAFEVRWGELEAARPFFQAAEEHLALFAPAHPAREHLEAMVAAIGVQIAIADQDIPAAREQAARSYRAAVGARDMPLLAQASGALAELAVALGRPERAVEVLAATTVVRGGDDPTDPTAARLAPLLRAALGDDRFEAVYVSGKALDRAEAIERLDPTLPA
jgi:ATP/maltotriose-dependent transcriptional regulator MalT